MAVETPGSSLNIEDADKVVHDAVNNADFFKLKDKAPENPVDQSLVPQGGREHGPQFPEDNEAQLQGASGEYTPAPLGANSPVDNQDVYFQTPNSVYQNEEELKKGMLAKDAYIDQLKQKEVAYGEIIKAIGTSINGVPQQQVLAPVSPRVISREDREDEFTRLEEQYGRVGAMTMLAEQIADEKLAIRDQHNEQDRQETQGYVDDLRRQNPGIPNETVNALKSRYLELKDTQINPLAVLYNPQVNNPYQHINKDPQIPVAVQDKINAENRHFRQKVNTLEKKYIPRSPHGKTNPVNQADEIRNRLVDKVRSGDPEGVMDLAFKVAQVTAEQSQGQRRG